ncbi:hypothetical protein [Streptomyces sp. NPDC052496]|uniref:hypothetical protein n=1 Tax=Streptomyces sp. NPDC052496 TaxID=3154951 RepID=UPI003423F88C
MTTAREDRTGTGRTGPRTAPKVSALGHVIAAAVPVLVMPGAAACSTDEPAAPREYAEVVPGTMAERVLSASEDAYRPLGLRRTIPGSRRGEPGPRTASTLFSNPCHRIGAASAEDPPVDGAYRLSHHWTLDRVPWSKARPALERLRDRLNAPATFPRP